MHNQVIAEKEAAESAHLQQVEHLEQLQKQLQQQVQEEQDQITSLENELIARKEVIDAANEQIVIKEAEVARLEAKISGYERATFGVSTSRGKRPSSQGRKRTVPPLLPSLGPTLHLSPGSSRNNSADFHPNQSGTFMEEHTAFNSTRQLGISGPPSNRTNLSVSRSHEFELPMGRDSELSQDRGSFGAYAPSETDSEAIETFEGMLKHVNKHISKEDSRSRIPVPLNRAEFRPREYHQTSSNRTPTKAQPLSSHFVSPSDRHAYHDESSQYMFQSTPTKTSQGLPSGASFRARSVSPTPEKSEQSYVTRGHPMTRSSSLPYLAGMDVGAADATWPDVTLNSLGSAPDSPGSFLDQTDDHYQQTTSNDMEPSQHMRTLQERLRANELRRQEIEHQLADMHGSMQRAQDRIGPSDR
ncbi:uncharacterized protein LOC118421675 [Branchiostoma floridae]|uniref:Uncharacterized protein LOC118421675 n=1 Tax=Branchiostoma floridae TaxID=7739 RepID=A0A9J7LNL4_BRAFL|nr:uncharacterized protein LOC118421675 [Branchiostoma floridae]